MRDIKYRVWYTELEAMLSEYLGFSITDTGKLFIEAFDGEEATIEEVDTEKYIVMQYTGLKDKNDIEIYEGDILSGTAIAKEGGFNYRGKVVFINQSNVHGYFLEDAKGGSWRLDQLCARISLDHITGEVVGNIYQEPRL